MKVRQISVTQIQLDSGGGETHVTGNVKVYDYATQMETLLDGVCVIAMPLAAQLGKDPQGVEEFIMNRFKEKISNVKESRVY